MANCDVCNEPTSWSLGTIYTANEFRLLVSNGYEPDQPLLRSMMGESREHYIRRWTQGIVAHSTTDWLLCPTCATQAALYMAKPSGLPKPAGSGVRPSRMRIFLSHSSADRAFADALAEALRQHGTDVWIDDSHLGTGQLIEEITCQLRTRQVFIVVLSKAAFGSEWVRRECKWAFNLYERDRGRLILPVVASRIEPRDFDEMLYLEDFRRVEGPRHSPYSQEEAIGRTLALLQLSPTDPHYGSPAHRPLASNAADLLIEGRALNAQGRHSEALRVLVDAVQMAPRSADIWLSLSFTYGQLGAYEEALAACDRVLEIVPDSAAALSNKGAALAGLGLQSQALAALDHALAVDPTFSHAWYLKGKIHADQHRYEIALNDFERALALDADYADAWNGMGSVLNSLGMHQEALEANQRALALEPELLYAAHGVGVALDGLGRHSEAVQAFDCALVLDPSYAAAWNGRGYALFALNRLDEALYALDRALALDPSMLVASANKALVLSALERVAEAQQIAERLEKSIVGQGTPTAGHQ